MITLKTGTIGSGKTLSAVSEIAALQKRWEKNPSEWREVFAFGVRDLALPHRSLPAYPAGGKPGDPIEYDDLGQPRTDCIPQWDQVPAGAIVIIDECHRMFPSMGPGRPPSHIAWLDMSRQAGIDLILITQHPRKLHTYARTSVNKHQHYRRLMGGKRSMVYEWDETSTALNYRSATTRLFNYPSEAFKWYKSADEHTKLKFAVPAWVAVPIGAIVLGVFALPSAYSALMGAATGKGIGSTADAVQPSESASAPAVAAASPEPETPATEPPRIVGCIDGPRGAFCLDSQGQRVDMPPDVVAWNARNMGGLIRYDMGNSAPPAAPFQASTATDEDTKPGAPAVPHGGPPSNPDAVADGMLIGAMRAGAL